MKNNYLVIDTNVFLSEPYALFTFKENQTIVIPMVVLEELDEFKQEKNTIAYNARTIIKFLEQISQLGDIRTGIEIDNEKCSFLLNYESIFKCTVKLVPSNENIQKRSQDFYLTSNDNKILSVCSDLMDQNISTTLLSNDLNLRIKARSLNILAKEFDIHPNTDFNSLKGFVAKSLPNSEWQQLTTKNLQKSFALPSLCNNEYLIVTSEENKNKKKIFRYNQENGFKECFPAKPLWGFEPKSNPQRIALDLLLDDTIPLVFLIGPAGTGKTLLTLLAGLNKVLHQNKYDRLFVARPLVSLGSDIGFVPGDLQEKLFHWMHPFYDNLDFIFREIDLKGEQFIIPKRLGYELSSEVKKKGRRFADRKFMADEFFGTNGGSIHETVAHLQRKGFVSLEAITHMRGRTLIKQFMFIDEVQNLTPQEVKTIITRAGNGTKIVLAGDPYQIDVPNMDFYSNGLITSLAKLRGENLVGYAFLDESERGELASVAIRRL